jgi:outer membrane biosynthesis protein TonB
MSAKRKHRTTNEYLKYLKGELSHEERHSFERDMEADPFDMEAMEGLETIAPKEAEEDLLSLHSTLNRRLKRRRRITIYSIAASVASLLIVGTFFLNIYNFSPRSAEESIPNDESFLHDGAATESEASLDEDKSAARMIEEEEAPVQSESLSRDVTPVQEKPQILEEVQVLEEVSFQEATPAQMQAPAPEDIVVQEPVLVREKQDLQVAEVVSNEAKQAPAPAADEMVVIEAQPQRSQKKGRAQEAPSLYATERVSGIVVSSEDMEPVHGATIMIKGSNTGLVTDMEGRFSIDTDQQSETTVVASFIGMETTEYQLTGDKENQVVLQPDMASFDEVVVIGYGVEKEAYATGAVQKVQIDKEEVTYSGAEPEGGLEAFKMYIEQNIRFPAGDTISQRGVVVLKLSVARDGTISQIQTLSSPGDPFTEEAIRLLKEGPAWSPAQNENGTTDDVVRMRIVFKK